MFEFNIKLNVEIYSRNLRGGKAFAAEPKIRELKKTLLRSKRMKQIKGKRIKPNELIKKATFNLNNTRSAKYGYLTPPLPHPPIPLPPNKLKNRQ